MAYRLGDYDIWYKPCEKCGYDTAKNSRLREDATPRCWRCGSRVHRDYSERALKKGAKPIPAGDLTKPKN